MGRTRGAALVVAVLVAGACAAPGPGSSGGPCPLFPADNVWHARVDGLAVHPRDGAWRASIGAGAGLKADFGSGTWDGGPIGIPITEVTATAPAVPVEFLYADESDPGPYPVPADARREWGRDHHVLVVDRAACRLHELYDADRRPDGSWSAGSGAVWDLRSNALRPAGWTSADAAGLPVAAGLARYEEVASGRIDHALRFTAPRTQHAYVWPARHRAGVSSDPSLPPMGAWFRLRSDYDTSGLHPQARVVAEALKVHGMVLADNGSSWFLSGEPDPRWDDDGLRDLMAITGADLQAVDTAPLMVHPDSGRAR